MVLDALALPQHQAISLRTLQDSVRDTAGSIVGYLRDAPTMIEFAVAYLAVSLFMLVLVILLGTKAKLDTIAEELRNLRAQVEETNTLVRTKKAPTNLADPVS